MKITEKIFEVLMVLFYYTLYFCGLDFGLYNFKLMTTANGINAVAHFFIGTVTLAIFLMLTKLNIEFIASACRKHIKTKRGNK